MLPELVERAHRRRAMLVEHELLVLLIAAERLPSSPESDERRRELHAALDPSAGLSLEAACAFAIDRAEEDVAAFVRDIRASLVALGVAKVVARGERATFRVGSAVVHAAEARCARARIE